MLKNEDEIITIIQAIEEKKKELSNAKFIVDFYPTIINELESRLFNLIKEEEDMHGITGGFKGTEKNKPSKRLLYR